MVPYDTNFIQSCPKKPKEWNNKPDLIFFLSYLKLPSSSTGQVLNFHVIPKGNERTNKK